MDAEFSYAIYQDTERRHQHPLRCRSKITTTSGLSLLVMQKTALQDYFTSFKNLIDLLPQYQ